MRDDAPPARPVTTDELAMLPAGAFLSRVTAAPATMARRKSLKVELTEAVSRGRMGVDFGDEPTFVLLPETMRDGTIEVDVLGRLAATAPPEARAFIGLAYRVQGAGESYESVYLRPLNGRRLDPPAPRDRRAVQYYAYPHWKFDRLRQEHPDGSYESGADIAPDEWIRLRLEIDGTRLRAFTNGCEVLTLSETKAVPVAGRIGLWIDIGTEGYFADLRVTRR